MPTVRMKRVAPGLYTAKAEMAHDGTAVDVTVECLGGEHVGYAGCWRVEIAEPGCIGYVVGHGDHDPAPTKREAVADAETMVARMVRDARYGWVTPGG